MRINDEKTSDFGAFDDHSANRVTATELIDGVQHLLVLEQDESGCYREVILEPLASWEHEQLVHAAT